MVAFDIAFDVFFYLNLDFKIQCCFKNWKCVIKSENFELYQNIRAIGFKYHHSFRTSHASWCKKATMAQRPQAIGIGCVKVNFFRWPTTDIITGNVTRPLNNSLILYWPCCMSSSKPFRVASYISHQHPDKTTWLLNFNLNFLMLLSIWFQFAALKTIRFLYR